jgi:hypothetical protein
MTTFGPESTNPPVGSKANDVAMYATIIFLEGLSFYVENLWQQY